MIKLVKKLTLCLAVLVLAVSSCAAETADASAPDLTNYKKVLAWVKETQPASLDLGESPFTVEQLYNIKQALPEGASFTWSMKLNKITITSEDTVVDLDQGVSKFEPVMLEQLVYLLPQVKTINCFNHTYLKNKDMAAICDKYPDVDFGWCIHITGVPPLRTDATAFSTFQHVHPKNPLSSTAFKYLKYAKNLKAIDLGHNRVTDLDFLKDFTDLHIIILTDNQVSDISVLKNMPNLEFVELIKNKITDFTPLEGKENILDLNISYNPCTDISFFEDLPNLKRFWFVKTKVPEEQVTHFNQARPDVSATTLEEFTSVMTEKDWQRWRSENPRYHEYEPCFHTREWKPFTTLD